MILKRKQARLRTGKIFRSLSKTASCTVTAQVYCCGYGNFGGATLPLPKNAAVTTVVTNEGVNARMVTTPSRVHVALLVGLDKLVPTLDVAPDSFAGFAQKRDCPTFDFLCQLY